MTRHLLAGALALACFSAPVVASSTAAECDCTFYAIEALQRIGARLRVIPSVVVNDEHRFPGVYSAGVVAVKDPANCRVLTHEFYHAWQEQQLGPLPNLGDRQWYALERDAALTTMFATEMRGECTR